MSEERWTIYVDSEGRYPPVIPGRDEGPEDADEMAARLAANMIPVEVVSRSRLERAEEALRPFAEAAEELDRREKAGQSIWVDDEQAEALVDSSNWITVGDLRRAREALAHPEEPK